MTIDGPSALAMPRLRARMDAVCIRIGARVCGNGCRGRRHRPCRRGRCRSALRSLRRPANASAAAVVAGARGCCAGATGPDCAGPLSAPPGRRTRRCGGAAGSGASPASLPSPPLPSPPTDDPHHPPPRVGCPFPPSPCGAAGMDRSAGPSAAGRAGAHRALRVPPQRAPRADRAPAAARRPGACHAGATELPRWAAPLGPFSPP